MPPLGGQARRISATAKVVCSLAHTGSIPYQERSELAQVASFVAFPTLLLTFLTALLLALLWFLRGSLALRSLVLALRPWCLLLTLGRTLLWLLPLGPGCRGTLLRKCLGGGGPLNVCACLLRRLSARGRCSALLK